ncbi:unnamed protein product [Boreogadus saida]
MVSNAALRSRRMRMDWSVRFSDRGNGLYQGGFDYLEHMPDDLLLSIMSYLPIKDVAQLAKTTYPEASSTLLFVGQ